MWIYAVLFFGWLFFTHFVGDFIIQTGKQATNKSANIGALTTHIFTYTLTLVVMLSFLAYIDTSAGLDDIYIDGVIAYSMVNGALHFVTDFFTSKASKKAMSEEKIKLFWIIIGFDQFIHQFCLIATIPLLF
jgi:hypothetical protein